MGGGKSLNINYLQISKLRFPEFYGEIEWEEKKLGECFIMITERNKENNQNVLTISAQYGLVSQYDYFSKNIASTDVSNYFLISKGDFAYNKSRSQGHSYGAIKSLRLYEKGIVSPLYICFRKKDPDIDDRFVEYYFDTDLIDAEISQIAQEGARNHGLLNISTNDFFDNVSISFPSLPEQRKIASCLSMMDDQINAYTEKVGLLGQYRKGLMQLMFPQNQMN
jgi:type I restriction enzyme S subunit